ncbi:2OG-Fe(II) oxygenase [Pelomonas sp. KK5]|uniref:2OG-Fe(II) oxygenase n=1 Tax=Pelomonas sp. KK5 TaxID=1855730 RepID=UPI00097BBA03|nr:2OG-Fe(II) oxygenase [Pelomonas sp. KK5]
MTMMMKVSARLNLPGVMPVLAVLNEVLSPEECAALIELARPRLAPSTLVDPASGMSVVSGQRQSLGMFFRPGENDLVARIDERFAALTGLPASHGEGLQILHYPTGAGSAPHYDWLQPNSATNQASLARSGQRIATLVAYLNDVPAGGETAFPELGWSVTPQRGSAVYFQSCDGKGQLYPASVHHSLPVTQGEKWVATKWTRTRPFVSA